MLFAAWANLHGGWIVGLGVAVLWLVGRTIDRRSDRAPIAEAVVLAAALPATLLTPYGWRLWEFLTRRKRGV